MNTTNKIIECLEDKFSEYKQPVTILSRTDAGNVRLGRNIQTL